MVPASQKRRYHAMKQLSSAASWDRRLLMNRAAEVAPAMEYLPCPSYSSSSSTSSSFFLDGNEDPASPLNLPLMPSYRRSRQALSTRPLSLVTAAASIFRSFFPALQSLLLPTCQWMAGPAVAAPTSARPSRRRVTGTFFGAKKGRVNFVVQEHPRAEPLLLLELATPTSHLVKEMASGTVRILLECERNAAAAASAAAAAAAAKGKRIQHQALWDEPLWTMYCNGHRSGYAVSRPCTPADMHVLSAVQAVSVGAGVLPAAPRQPAALPSPRPSAAGSLAVEGGGGTEVMYMRSRFERVIGSRHSEAFYMMSPDCAVGDKRDTGGPELSIFLLRT